MDYIFTFLLYSLILLCIPSLFHMAIQYKEKNKILNYAVMYFIVLLILGLVAGFRGETGTDTRMYKRVYETQNFITIYGDSIEPGFVMLCKILYALKLPSQAMLFFMCILQSFFVFKAIEYEKEVIDVRLAIYIYLAILYFSSFNMLRQAVAMGICLYAMVVFLDKKYIQGILFVLLAMQFHEKSFIVLGMILAKLVFERSSKIFMAIVFAIVFYMVLHRELLNEIFNFFMGYYTGYLSIYTETDGSVFNYLIKVTPIIILMVFGYYSSDKKYFTIMGITVIGIILGALNYITNTQVGRIGEFLSCLEIIILPYIARSKLKVKNYIVLPQKIRYVIYAYFFTTFIYDYAYRNFGQLFPYGKYY